MEKKERLEEEFELEDEEEAFKDYVCVAKLLSVNYSLIADELSGLGDFKAGKALDIGTGLGDLAIEVAKRYPGLKITGIDIAKQSIREASSRAKAENLINADFKLADVHDLPFEDNSVDLVVSHGALHHLRELPRALSEIYRVLKPGGLAYLTDLKRDAPEELIKEVEASLPSSQARAFINSMRASYIPSEIKEALVKIGVGNFEVGEQRFSRQAIIKNMEKLRLSPKKSSGYSRLSQAVFFRKK